MAFDVKTFTTRATTALVFVAVMLAGLLGPLPIFLALFSVITWVGLQEYSRLLQAIFQTEFSKQQTFSFSLLGMSALGMTYFAPLQAPSAEWPYAGFTLFFYWVGLFIGFLMMFLWFTKGSKSRYLLSGVGYIGLSIGLYAQLRFAHALLPMALIALIWTNDTMAYLSGSFIGKNPLMASVSPKKTIEGTLGGIVFTVLIAALGSRFFPEFSMGYWMALAFIASVIGTAGDLVESKLKRMAGVKDSGNIMPGHGGVLDRFDSLLLSAPFAFLLELLWPKA